MYTNLVGTSFIFSCFKIIFLFFSCLNKQLKLFFIKITQLLLAQVFLFLFEIYTTFRGISLAYIYSAYFASI